MVSFSYFYGKIWAFSGCPWESCIEQKNCFDPKCEFRPEIQCRRYRSGQPGVLLHEPGVLIRQKRTLCLRIYMLPSGSRPYRPNCYDWSVFVKRYHRVLTYRIDVVVINRALWSGFAVTYRRCGHNPCLMIGIVTPSRKTDVWRSENRWKKGSLFLATPKISFLDEGHKINLLDFTFSILCRRHAQLRTFHVVKWRLFLLTLSLIHRQLEFIMPFIVMLFA